MVSQLTHVVAWTWLQVAITENLLDRLEDCKRQFPVAAVLGGAGNHIKLCKRAFLRLLFLSLIFAHMIGFGCMHESPGESGSCLKHDHVKQEPCKKFVVASAMCIQMAVTMSLMSATKDTCAHRSCSHV